MKDGGFDGSSLWNGGGGPSRLEPSFEGAGDSFDRLTDLSADII